MLNISKIFFAFIFYVIFFIALINFIPIHAFLFSAWRSRRHATECPPARGRFPRIPPEPLFRNHIETCVQHPQGDGNKLKQMVFLYIHAPEHGERTGGDDRTWAARRTRWAKKRAHAVGRSGPQSGARREQEDIFPKGARRPGPVP